MDPQSILERNLSIDEDSEVMIPRNKIYQATDFFDGMSIGRINPEILLKTEEKAMHLASKVSHHEKRMKQKQPEVETLRFLDYPSNLAFLSPIERILKDNTPNLRLVIKEAYQSSPD